MSKPSYVCQQCGVVSLKWKGRCDSCQQWDTFSEQVAENLDNQKITSVANFESLRQNNPINLHRLSSGIEEFDRVCGGGLVAGSVTLVAGDPGIGKSTLLLQLACNLSKQTSVVYVSGEESAGQIRLRAQRLELQESPIYLISTNYLDDVFNKIPEVLSENPIKAFMIIDSIQTMALKEVGPAVGTIGQIRECMHQLITLAKSTGIAVIVVGHITKEGAIAGPKVLEHMVDTVLYFEGDANRPYRLLRTIKNRFGPTNEVGVFDMTSHGLKEVRNPSALFLSQRQQQVPGSCIFAGIEGTRPLFVEFQALSTSSFLVSPRRSVVGWDANRLSMILAVLEARCNLSFAKKDVFLTVLGGIKVTEPAADLCVAFALMSCLKKRAIPQQAVAFGEIGLTGEIYSACFSDQRIRSAEQLGFNHVFMPGNAPPSDGVAHTRMKHVRDLDLWFNS